MLDTIFASLVNLQAAEAEAGGEALDPWQLIADASGVVQMVMALLVIMGLVCWFITGAKVLRIGRAIRRSRAFLAEFNNGGDAWSTERLEAVYGKLASFDGSPLAMAFHAGYVELARVMGSGKADRVDLENIERALKRAGTAELTSLEAMLPFLATTGSTAPFVGLFGTVWGIMNSFLGIRNEGSASLDTVAPGIAEALIATAIGLLAAIPAVVAYNYFVRKIRVVESEVETFSSDFLNIVRRHFLRS